MSDMKTIFQTELTQVSQTDLEGAGTLRFTDDGRVYRWVQNRSSTTALVANQSVCYHVASAAAGSETFYKSVFTPATANLGALAGALETGIAADYYGWVQVEGFKPDLLVKLPKTATDIIVSCTLLGVDATTTPAKDQLLGTAPVYTSTIVALESVATAAAASTTSIAAYIKCYF